uniref:NADH:ubiquinone oxidoreductase intermediate-associated protein 30 domain-containing protein n=1 Tax=Cacopsylla melanoneura TaxID=428564 RepID=A0A8D8WGI7_9HEMI
MEKLPPEFLISAFLLLCHFHLSTSSNVTHLRNTTEHSTATEHSTVTKHSTATKHNITTKLTNATAHNNSSLSLVFDSEKFMNQTGGLMIFDFRKIDYLDDWSDNMGDVMKTSMALMMFKNKPPHQRALLFTRLHPNDDQFGSKAKVQLNLNNYQKLIMYGRVVGSFAGYKVILRHEGKHDKEHPWYEQEFIGKPVDHLIEMHLSQFKPMYNGYFVHDAPPLNKANITQIEILVQRDNDGKKKEEEASRLELEWIKAVKKEKKPKFGRKKQITKGWESFKSKLKI